MKDPNELLVYENKERESGVNLIAGVDEVGRGHLRDLSFVLVVLCR